MAKQTISIVLPDLRGGGAERVNLDLAKGFQARGFAVTFVLRNAKGELLEEAKSVGRIVDLKSPRVRSVINPLAAYIAEERPDALLASLWPLTTITAWAAARAGHPCPLVLAEHGMLSRQYEGKGRLHAWALRKSLQYGMRRADAVVGVSKGVADDLASLTGSDRDRFDVIYNPVPGPDAPDSADRAQVETLWNGGLGKRIITVGTFKAVKNQSLLIDAFASLNDPEARLMLVGDGDLRIDLENRARDRGVAEQVIFAGFQTNPAAYYATANAFALSSRREGFGNVIVEAMNHGLTIVSTDCPTGPREILDAGTFGHLTPPGDPDALAAALRKALANPSDPEHQKSRAAEFRPDVAVEAYLRLLFPESGRFVDA